MHLNTEPCIASGAGHGGGTQQHLAVSIPFGFAYLPPDVFACYVSTSSVLMVGKGYGVLAKALYLYLTAGSTLHAVHPV